MCGNTTQKVALECNLGGVRPRPKLPPGKHRRGHELRESLIFAHPCFGRPQTYQDAQMLDA
jgi:hypothetical protein